MPKAFRLSLCAPILFSTAACFVGCDSGGSPAQGPEVGKPAMTQEEQKAESEKREAAIKESMKKGAKK